MPTPTPPAGISVRRARPTDLAALHSLVERCSAETLYRRFHGVAGTGARRELTRIAAPTDRHRSWVAVGPGGLVHGTSTLAWGRDGTVDVAFLVEDGHRRRGIGRALVAATATEARRSGLATIEAVMQGDNVAATRFLKAVVPGVAVRIVHGEAVASIPVGPVDPAGTTRAPTGHPDEEAA